jgi:hypothetical protein
MPEENAAVSATSTNDGQVFVLQGKSGLLIFCSRGFS